MRLILAFTVLLSIISCSPRSAEQVALEYFCTELVGKEIFLGFGEDDKVVLPPNLLEEEFFENGFLADKDLFLFGKITELTKPVEFDNNSISKEQYQAFLKQYNSSQPDMNIKSECFNLIPYHSSDESLRHKAVIIRVKHHLSAAQEKLVEITYTIDQLDFSIWFLLDNDNNVIDWQ
ncbi:hypothetical protein [Roseivirga pacifica]|uniref:hypothetical protein n=1 Tax=Roseivirga pacifica TaxID=1267423 RepID=UPI00227C58E2|nr:hypothetical protein [Roseivirga pacifica]